MFVDSNVWIAHVNKRDKWRAHAEKIMEEIKFKEVRVTKGIVLETVNFLFRKNGKSAAEKMLDAFTLGAEIEIVETTEAVWQKALEYFRKYELSLVDAEIVAHMEAWGDKKLYSFDRGFDQVKWIERIG